MTLKRLSATAFALCLGLLLGSCGSFSDFVANHWPYIAGGEPNGIPPRPGEPGYARFIAHGQPPQSTGSAAGVVQPAANNGNAAAAAARPAAPDRTPAPLGQKPATSDESAVSGGLY